MSIQRLKNVVDLVTFLLLQSKSISQKLIFPIFLLQLLKNRETKKNFEKILHAN